MPLKLFTDESLLEMEVEDYKMNRLRRKSEIIFSYRFGEARALPTKNLGPFRAFRAMSNQCKQMDTCHAITLALLQTFEKLDLSQVLSFAKLTNF